jgi:3-oxoacid CoA-transferase subunit B
MEHVARDGSAKILPRCTLPLTGAGVIDRIITDIAVIDITPDGLVLREVAPGWSAAEVQNLTGAPLATEGDIATIAVR